MGRQTSARWENKPAALNVNISKTVEDASKVTIIISFIYSTTKQYKYSDKRWHKWSWNWNDKADSSYSHPSVLKT